MSLCALKFCRKYIDPLRSETSLNCNQNHVINFDFFYYVTIRFHKWGDFAGRRTIIIHRDFNHQFHKWGELAEVNLKGFNLFDQCAISI